MKLHGFNYASASIQAAPRDTSPPPPSRGSRLVELVAPKPGAWQLQALCKGQTRGPDSPWINPAANTVDAVQACLRLCARCPVQDECAAMPRPIGITGGAVWTTALGHKTRRQTARQCAWCREVFYGERSQQAYCSTNCSWEHEKDRARRATKPKKCAVCKQLFTPEGKAKTCSFVCRKKAEKRNGKRTTPVVTNGDRPRTLFGAAPVPVNNPGECA